MRERVKETQGVLQARGGEGIYGEKRQRLPKILLVAFCGWSASGLELALSHTSWTRYAGHAYKGKNLHTREVEGVRRQDTKQEGIGLGDGRLARVV